MATLLLPLGVLLIFYGELPAVPPNWIPWGEIEIDQDPTWFAHWQISRLESKPEVCFAALERSAIEFRHLDDRPMRDGCGVLMRVEIVRSNIPYSSGFEAPCPLAAALYWYERQIQLHADEYLGRRISRIEHFGTYACRNIYRRPGDRRSAHATARAIDISGFVLEDGTLISVLDDWGEDSPESDFLLAIRDEACRFFGLVLSPDYNAAHANHLHLELRRYSRCR